MNDGHYFIFKRVMGIKVSSMLFATVSHYFFSRGRGIKLIALTPNSLDSIK